MKIQLNKTFLANELSKSLSLKIEGDINQKFNSISNIDDTENSSLKFTKKSSNEYLKGVIIGPSGTKAETLIISDNPRLDFCKALNYFINNNELIFTSRESSIHSSSYIAKTAIIEEGVHIGANSVIEHNVVIHKNSTIGRNCIIRSNSVVGAQGFGFEQDLDGKWIRFPHLGAVDIGDNVEIGALNSVCVGALGNTSINDGVKTDNLVHIAHNCKIGKNSILTACSELSGGVQLGENVWLGPNSTIMEKILVGDNALIGIGSLVRKNVKPNTIVAGSPAKFIRNK